MSVSIFKSWSSFFSYSLTRILKSSSILNSLKCFLLRERWLNFCTEACSFQNKFWKMKTTALRFKTFEFFLIFADLWNWFNARAKRQIKHNILKWCNSVNSQTSITCYLNKIKNIVHLICDIKVEGRSKSVGVIADRKKSKIIRTGNRFSTVHLTKNCYRNWYC